MHSTTSGNTAHESLQQSAVAKLTQLKMGSDATLFADGWNTALDLIISGARAVEAMPTIDTGTPYAHGWNYAVKAAEAILTPPAR